MPNRTIHEIMTDFELVAQSNTKIDAYEILSEILEDIVDSYRLAMKDSFMPVKAQNDIDAMVTDYISNNIFT